MIRILHTGDIHLDCPFSSLDARQAETRKNELRAAFTSMMTYARMNQVDLVLIAGDMFDNSFVTRETIAIIKKEFEKLSCPIVITPGNHDCADNDSIWRKNVFPSNVHIFTDENLTSFEFDEIGGGVTVYGYAFTKPDMTTSPIESLRVDDRNRINLLCAHCDLDVTTSTNCPITKKQLSQFGADYAALAHVHNPSTPGENNRYAYCGCLEGRDFGELGHKGAVIAEIEKKGYESEVKLKRIRFSKRRYEADEIDVSGCESMSDITHAVEEFIKTARYSDDTLLKLKLKGTVPPHVVINTQEMEKAKYGVSYLKVLDGTIPVPDEKTLGDDTSFISELYRVLKPKLDSSDEREREVALRAFRYACAAITGDSVL